MTSKYKWIFTFLVALSVQFSFAQEKTVTGVVSDTSGPLPSANVLVQGTKTSTQSDINGKYSIKANVGDVLVFSFVGMSDSTTKIGSTNAYNVILSSGKELDTVVIGALGIKHKKDAVTSTYAVVSGEELRTASNPDAVRSLQGKVSGVIVNATGSGVAGSNSIRIRSMLSVGGNTEALVVIDNVVSTADVLASLPSDVIENITILKGAQGAALYGSLGKQGVVLVQTKKSSKDKKFKVDFSSTSDFEQISFVPQKQTSYGQGWFGTYYNDENGGWGPLFDGVVRQIGLAGPDGSIVSAPYSSLGSDNLKEFYKSGVIYQHNLNINLTGEDSYLNFNMGNVNRDFILQGDKLNRNTFVLSAGKKIGKLNLGGTFTLINSKTEQANVNSATSRGDYTLLTNLLQTASNIPIGLFKDRGLYGWNAYYQNPFWARDNNRLIEKGNFINLGINANYEINKHINIGYNATGQLRNNNQISYSNQAISPAEYLAIAGFNSPASYYQSDFQSIYHYGDLLASFDYDVLKDLNFKGTIGQNFIYSSSDRISQGGLNLQIPYFYHITNVLNPDTPSSLRNRKEFQKATATFINLDFSYKDYLFLNLTGRYEGNSLATKGKDFVPFNSAGLSFVPTKAFNIMKNKTNLSNLKIYANYTRIGSFDPIDVYGSADLAQVANGFPFPNTGLSYNDRFIRTDPNINPEIYTTLEAGLNFGFLKDRITLDLTGFNVKTTNLITDSSVSNTTGLSNITSNVGSLEAKGFEIELAFMPLKTENFNWSGRVFYSENDTKVISLAPGIDKSVIYDGGNSSINADISAVVGYSFPYITGTDWNRDSQGRVIINPITAFPGYGTPTSGSKFIPLAKVTPDYTLGFYNKFEYKGFSLAVTSEYRNGHSFVSQTKHNLTWNGHLAESGDVSRSMGWLIPDSSIADPNNPGQYIDNGSVLTGGNYTNQTNAGNRTLAYYGVASGVGSFNVIDATNLRIREISLGYSLPQKFIKKTFFQAVKLSVHARNPFIFFVDKRDLFKPSNNLGYADPEVSNQNNSSSSPAAKQPAGTLTNTSRNGLGYIGDGQYPSTKTYGFSLNLTF